MKLLWKRFKSFNDRFETVFPCTTNFMFICETLLKPRYQATKSPIGIFPLCQEATRSEATRYVKRLLEPTSKTFQLFFNNCRDHTDRAIRGLCCDGKCCPKGREEALRNTQARRFEDSDYIRRGSLALASLISCFVAYKYITRSS